MWLCTNSKCRSNIDSEYRYCPWCGELQNSCDGINNGKARIENKDSLNEIYQDLWKIKDDLSTHWWPNRLPQRTHRLIIDIDKKLLEMANNLYSNHLKVES
jgi:hypothetical protein